SSFVGNRSPSGAGALDVRGSARLTASTLARNRGAIGGAIDVRGGGSVVLSNATLSGNRAAGLGGAIHVGAGVAVLVNATVAGNRAGAGGGGIALGTGGVLEAVRSIVAANASDVGPADCAGRVTSLGRNVSSGRACGFDRPSDRVGVDARLRPLRSYGGPTETRALRPGSPAVDVGGDCGAADQRGAPRRGACDAGAYELVRCLGRPVDIVGTGEDDELSGGREPDTFLGRAGDDGFQGSLDEDRGCGGRGDDHLIGGPGGDRLAGGVGDDRLEGEDGPDRLLGGPGADVLIGGPGRDVCVTDPRDRAVGCEVERRRA
ncbi:MAG TPA: choice-of-anchor Q domain-containing protein, partial [Actinomycetota bacterium]